MELGTIIVGKIHSGKSMGNYLPTMQIPYIMIPIIFPVLMDSYVSLVYKVKFNKLNNTYNNYKIDL